MATIVKAWLAVPGMTLPATTTHAPTRIQGLFDGLPAMRQFGGKDDFATAITDERQSGGFAAGIKFEAQGFTHGRRHRACEHDREGKAFEHGGFARREQETGSPRMDGIHRLFLSIEYKNVAQDEPPVARVMVASTRFVSGLA
jgi:hypothetical protein